MGGGHKTLKADVCIIAATNRNLEEALEHENFRHDLYYRLNVLPIYMPPLRERKTDILLLADHFLEKYAKENHKDIRRLCRLERLGKGLKNLKNHLTQRLILSTNKLLIILGNNNFEGVFLSITKNWL